MTAKWRPAGKFTIRVNFTLGKVSKPACRQAGKTGARDARSERFGYFLQDPQPLKGDSGKHFTEKPNRRPAPPLPKAPRDV